MIYILLQCDYQKESQRDCSPKKLSFLGSFLVEETLVMRFQDAHPISWTDPKREKGKKKKNVKILRSSMYSAMVQCQKHSRILLSKYKLEIKPIHITFK